MEHAVLVNCTGCRKDIFFRVTGPGVADGINILTVIGYRRFAFTVAVDKFLIGLVEIFLFGIELTEKNRDIFFLIYMKDDGCKALYRDFGYIRSAIDSGGKLGIVTDEFQRVLELYRSVSVIVVEFAVQFSGGYRHKCGTARDVFDTSLGIHEAFKVT